MEVEVFFVILRACLIELRIISVRTSSCFPLYSMVRSVVPCFIPTVQMRQLAESMEHAACCISTMNSGACKVLGAPTAAAAKGRRGTIPKLTYASTASSRNNL
jgi:hypothetical protein